MAKIKVLIVDGQVFVKMLNRKAVDEDLILLQTGINNNG